MIARYLSEVAFSEEWGRQMRFIVGPRQAGKTTLARGFLEDSGWGGLYYLWDSREVRRRYQDNELFFTEDSFPVGGGVSPWVCFDEIHKYPKWKNVLKSIFDQVGDRYRIIVTGSAKLDILKKAGDSLAGRYFTFHLFTLTLNEVAGVPWSDYVLPAEDASEYLERIFDSGAGAGGGGGDGIETLLEYSGFPEPFLSQNKRFHRKWREDYIENVIKEDIGTLTRIIDRENIYGLYNILPGMIGSPISESSLASHIQVSPPTVKRYLKRLEDFYLAFSIRPYSRNIKRSLLKAPKYYLYDWSKVEDPGARFENYVACELRSNISLWNDLLGESYALFYIRDKEKREVDFLITRGSSPWLMVEVKLSDAPLSRHYVDTARTLNVPIVQICLKPDVLSMQRENCFRVSANRFFHA